MLWQPMYVIVFYCNRKETDQCCLTVDAASTYDHCLYCTSRSLAPPLQNFTHAIPQMAVDQGDLMQKIIGVWASGEMLNWVNTINDMVD